LEISRLIAERSRKSFDLDCDYPEARFYQGLLDYQEHNYDRVIQSRSASDVPLDIGVLATAFARKGCESRARECVEKLGRMAGSQYVTPLAEAFAATGMERFDLVSCHIDS